MNMFQRSYLNAEPPPSAPEVTRRSPTPPVTALEFRDALRHLVALEKKMRLEMQSNLRELKLHMTQRRVDRVANKAQKLFQIRQQARHPQSSFSLKYKTKSLSNLLH